MAGGFVFVNDTLGNHGVDKRYRIVVGGLGLIFVTTFNCFDHFFNGCTHFRALGCVMQSGVFRLPGSFFRLCAVSQNFLRLRLV